MPEKPVDGLVARPKPTDPVELDLFGDGSLRVLRYSIASIQRLKRKLGRSMMGLRGNLMDLDEELLPVLLLEGLRHDPVAPGQVCDCGHHAENGIDPDVTLDQLEQIPAYAYVYLLQRFSLAWTASRPESRPAIAVNPETAAPASKPN